MRALPKFIAAAFGLVIATSFVAARAADAVPAPAPGQTAASAASQATTNATLQQLDRLIKKVQAGLNEGKKTEAEFATELKEFDTLLSKSGGPDEAARVLAMKALLYVQVFEDLAKGKELFKKITTDYPGASTAKQAEQVIIDIERVERLRKIQESLVPGTKFPDFEEKDIEGKPLSVGRYKGKVVLVDFWATWCGPCRIELPNVIATYEKHHKNGFEILGISLDKDAETMKKFTADSGMTWQQYFDGQLWQNKLAQQYGIMSIPATFLLDRHGTIIGRDLRGPDLDKAVADALAKK